jgi:16S rRNA (guanine527-N7)-methyltransferase
VLELGLRNVEIHQGRVELWQPAQRFAVVISRAFAELKRFLDACRHLVAPGGVLAAMKGAAPAELDSDWQLISLRVPQLNAQRHLVLCPPSSR